MHENYAKFVAPPSKECENYVACLKVQSVTKTTLHTASKSAYKRQRNACSNYSPTERMAHRTRSVQNKKQQKPKRTHFLNFSGARCTTLHKFRMAIQLIVHIVKGVIHFSFKRLITPTGCTENFGLFYRRAVSLQ